jgi:hypothetical protein
MDMVGAPGIVPSGGGQGDSTSAQEGLKMLPRRHSAGSAPPFRGPRPLLNSMGEQLSGDAMAGRYPGGTYGARIRLIENGHGRWLCEPESRGLSRFFLLTPHPAGP